MHGIELATGHHPNDLARYRELIGMTGSSTPRHLAEPPNANVIALLNVRYFIWPDAERGSVASGPEPIVRTQVGGRPYQSLYEVPTLPRARLVAAARVVPDSAAVPLILTPEFDPAIEAILAEPSPIPLEGGPVEGGVVWDEREIDHQRLTVTSDRNALLVIADNWFPAWRATVDGEEAPVLRAYHSVRAVPVGPGEHVVELRYESPVIEGSLILSTVAVLVLAGIGIASTARRRHERVV